MNLAKTTQLGIEHDPLQAHLPSFNSEPAPPRTRFAFAASHIVMQPGYVDVSHSREVPGTHEEIARHIDWEQTRSNRAHLASYGFGIAEAMDTAQRFQVGWDTSQRLIQLTSELAPPSGFIAGASHDHRPDVSNQNELAQAVAEQVQVIHAAGGVPIILPLPWLLGNGCDENLFVSSYTAIVEAIDVPVLLHWLGPRFMEGMDDYFPGRSFQRIMALDREKLIGVKLSLLDADFEEATRRELLEHGQVVLTGDDWNFASLMRGTSQTVHAHRPLGQLSLPYGDFSHGLLGIFGAIARPAQLALRALAIDDYEGYDAIMEPCTELGLHLFQTPTWGYRAGLAHIAYLNGWQDNSMLPNHEERSRPCEFFQQLTLLASRAGCFQDLDVVQARLRI